MLRTIQNRAVTLMSKTPPTLEDLKAKRQRILAIFEKHGATDVKVFGSVARGDANPNSDIDFLCTVPNPRLASPWFPGGLILELEAELGHSIDIGTEAETLASPIGEFIQGDVVAL